LCRRNRRGEAGHRAGARRGDATEAPASFRTGIIERSGIARRLPASARMIVRNLMRKPWKALVSVLGIGIAVGLMMVSASCSMRWIT